MCAHARARVFGGQAGQGWGERCCLELRIREHGSLSPQVIVRITWIKPGVALCTMPVITCDYITPCLSLTRLQTS